MRKLLHRIARQTREIETLRKALAGFTVGKYGAVTGEQLHDLLDELSRLRRAVGKPGDKSWSV